MLNGSQRQFIHTLNPTSYIRVLAMTIKLLKQMSNKTKGQKIHTVERIALKLRTGVCMYCYNLYTSANKLYVLASRTICLIAAIPPITTKIEEAAVINVFTQNFMLYFEGLKVIL